MVLLLAHDLPIGMRPIILDSLVGRARVGCWRRDWVGETTQRAPARKEEQRPQARCQWLNRVCSAVTHRVILIEAKIVNGHEHL